MRESETSNPTGEAKLTLTVGEAARALGVSRTTIYRLIAEGHLRASRALRRKLIPAGDLQRFLDQTSS